MKYPDKKLTLSYTPSTPPYLHVQRLQTKRRHKEAEAEAIFDKEFRLIEQVTILI